jgi:GTP cyclohydrolase I
MVARARLIDPGGSIVFARRSRVQATLGEKIAKIFHEPLNRKI